MKLQTPEGKEHNTADEQLYRAIAAIRDAEEAKKFMLDLCTPAEIQAMADRWRVVHLVKEGRPYRQIYEQTGVSVTTVGRVARSILLGAGGYNIIYARLENKLHAKKYQTKNRNTKKRSTK